MDIDNYKVVLIEDLKGRITGNQGHGLAGWVPWNFNGFTGNLRSKQQLRLVILKPNFKVVTQELLMFL
jgi:hypothetical protein